MAKRGRKRLKGVLRDELTGEKIPKLWWPVVLDQVPKVGDVIKAWGWTAPVLELGKEPWTQLVDGRWSGWVWVGDYEGFGKVKDGSYPSGWRPLFKRRRSAEEFATRAWLAGYRAKRKDKGEVM